MVPQSSGSLRMTLCHSDEHMIKDRVDTGGNETCGRRHDGLGDPNGMAHGAGNYESATIDPLALTLAMWSKEQMSNSSESGRLTIRLDFNSAAISG